MPDFQRARSTAAKQLRESAILDAALRARWKSGTVIRPS